MKEIVYIEFGVGKGSQVESPYMDLDSKKRAKSQVPMDKIPQICCL